MSSKKFLWIAAILGTLVFAVNAKAQVMQDASPQISTESAQTPSVIIATQPEIPTPQSLQPVDQFETGPWVLSKANGANIKTSSMTDSMNHALVIDYDLSGPGQWVSLSKEVPESDFQNRTVQFNYKVHGQKTDALEVRLVRNNGSALVHKFLLVPSDQWQTKIIRPGDFTEVNDPNRLEPRASGMSPTVNRIQFAITGDEGTRKAVYLNDLRFVP